MSRTKDAVALTRRTLKQFEEVKTARNEITAAIEAIHANPTDDAHTATGELMRHNAELARIETQSDMLYGQLARSRDELTEKRVELKAGHVEAIDDYRKRCRNEAEAFYHSELAEAVQRYYLASAYLYREARDSNWQTLPLAGIEIADNGMQISGPIDPDSRRELMESEERRKAELTERLASAAKAANVFIPEPKKSPLIDQVSTVINEIDAALDPTTCRADG